MFKFISHRGWWKTAVEKNSDIAFRRSFEAGFGTETDVRDLNGTLVISHDMASDASMPLGAFLDIFCDIDPQLELAMNIKADGLFDPLAAAFAERGVSNWYAFDMSVPDMVQYANRSIPFYTRQSDLETIPALLNRAQGVWIDQFFSPWFSYEVMDQHVAAGRRLCLVSPELHGRDPLAQWAIWRDWQTKLQHAGRDASLVTVCSDVPDEAIAFFQKV